MMAASALRRMQYSPETFNAGILLADYARNFLLGRFARET
jgi:hypothetical protein